MPYTIQQHLKYNAWANKQFANQLQSLDERILYSEIKSSFSSIAKTWLHMWDAEIVWLMRMKGTSLREWPSAKFEGDRDQLLNGLVNSSEEILSFIKSQPPSFVTSEITYINMKGDQFTDAIENVLYHMVNHGTYHRGQITTLLRQAGVINLVGTDLIHYLRTQK
jgi:uncharacterized damage-inducible protein DinB